MSKKSYNAIRRVVHNRTSNVALNTVWQKIHDETGTGNISSKQLFLTSEDHKNLRDWVILEVGVDPLTTKITGDRLDAAALSRDEKLATEAVFSGMMRASRLSGEIPLVQGNAVTPQGTLISVAADDILVNNIKTAIIVENGIIARDWYKCIVPDELATALVVYRGHGSEAGAVRAWLSNLPADIRKIGCFDFDPAGLGIAVDYSMDAILIPDPLNDDLIEGINNKPETHAKQLLNRPNLYDQLPKSCHWVLSWMTSEGRKCAVTQERLMVLGWPLRILELTNDQDL